MKIFKKTTQKRLRRTKGEIKRPYLCKFQDCGKSYGSDGALKMHIRLKHESGRKKGNTPNNPRPIIPLVGAQPITKQFLDSKYIQILPHAMTPFQLQNTEVSRMYEAINTPYPYNGYQETESDLPSVSEGRFNFNLMKIRSGSWQNVSSSPGSMILQFYGAERVFNLIFTNPIPLQIHIHFDKILAFSSEELVNGAQIFALELAFPPDFYSLDASTHQETWFPTKDFTGGNCSTYRIQILHLSKQSYSILIKQILNDPYLKRISQQIPGAIDPSNPETSGLLHIHKNITRNEVSLLYKKYLPMADQFSGKQPVFMVNPNARRNSKKMNENSDSQIDDSSHGSPQMPLVHSVESISEFIEPFCSETMERLERMCRSWNCEISSLSNCALQNLVTNMDNYVINFDDSFSLPCYHESISLRSLMLQKTNCSHCSTSYFYSFCLHTILPYHLYQHCSVCNQCIENNSWNDHNCLNFL